MIHKSLASQATYDTSCKHARFHFAFTAYFVIRCYHSLQKELNLVSGVNHATYTISGRVFPVKIISFSPHLPEIMGKRTAWSRVHLPCLEGETKLCFLSEYNRDVYTYLQTYELSKFRKGITDEVDFLFCRAGGKHRLEIIWEPVISR